MARVLWIGDAGSHTGFSQVTHSVAERLMLDHGHDVSVLAIGYEASDPLRTPLHLYRADAGRAHHPLGFDRVLEVMTRVQPDVVVTLEDPAMVLKRLYENPWDSEQVLRQLVPVISYLPVDGCNLPPAFDQLNEAVNVVAMSKFGQEQFPGSKLVYHGVDTNMWHSVDEDHPLETSAGTMRSKAACREVFNVPQDVFVVGRVDTNSGRKDWGSMFRVMDDFRSLYPGNSLAFWHTKRQSIGGVDLEALVSRGEGPYYITDSDEWPVEDVVALVNTFDVTLSTSRGEGFGFGLAQSLACGVPVIATAFSAISEVVGPGGICVAGAAVMTNPYGVDQMLADVPAMTAALVGLAGNPEERHRMGVLGREHVKNTFNWDRAAAEFHGYIEALAAQTQESPEAGSAQRRQS